MNRIIITAPSSGSGKTTVTCALLSALKTRGEKITAFKCGPDYIDPMFHRETAGVPTYNLDPFFLTGEELRRHVAMVHGGGIAVIEGAMGYYDGIANTDRASCYTVARETRSPVVLVVNAKGTGNSIAALIEGFCNHRADSGIRGVIFNGVTGSRYSDMKRLTESVGVAAYGYLPYDEKNSVASRHLGLVTAGEIADIKEKLSELGRMAEETLDIEALIELSGTAPVLEEVEPMEWSREKKIVRVAVARDKAFCFMYEENKEQLRRQGGEIVEFSPLEDKHLPEGIHALYLSGGYPELYAREISENRTLMEEIKEAVTGGMPTIAECGGFMVLGETLDGHSMAGVIAGRAYRTDRLQRFGYITLTAKRDNLLSEAGGRINAHEFHYWDSTETGDTYTAEKPGREIKYECIHGTDTMYAGYPHIYLTERMASRFMKKVREYANK